ncbi:glutamate-1-semialdehyde 2,1-aminomutase [Herbivorax sp. ANBcel31]|uniref:glutamate-1-semialdehyde 2,1-aminomutase n=1 Tax=Herbivorax sp. ANBcel31 TaxID=3069754 RepID=UPI0027B0BB65|nr:glutamate-1-semialdehyde 2,1-aminomutase [Herbivorax sp. ANBcel31]MDQ2086963.1 glutamate-1-semialdehyde 2,1-aminomutase [Herbivorax sp. ANBcel31]
MKNKRSAELFEASQKVMPGGVNSPVRAYKSVGLVPPFIKRAEGSKIIDCDGNTYIDYVGSWGPMILGYANKNVINEVKDALEDGTSFGAPTEREIELAEIICKEVPSVDMVRMVSSGTEAVMSAVRLARGYTKRDKILKFEGCYHGHSDGMLVKAGSGAMTTGVPDSDGVPKDYAKNTITASYNSFYEVEDIFKSVGSDIAAIIVEPVAANMGVIPPEEGFLKFLREITIKYGALLIFDEVITGFRISFSGAQGYYGINPDITVFGKIIGGGFPVGAYGGRLDIMKMISPEGTVYQAGTLSGNPVAMAAGIATLKILRDNPDIYDKIDKMASKLESSITDLKGKYDIPLAVNRIGSIMSVFFTNERVKDYSTVARSDSDMFCSYFKEMLNKGIYLAPSQFESMFISEAHSTEDIENTVKCIDKALKVLKGENK